MATYFTISFEGEPTESDLQRASQLVSEGYTEGELINDEDESEDD